MAVFLYEIIAILIFWRFADRSRLRELLPVVLTGSFLRYLEHYVLIDWLQIWTLPGPPWKELWLPITADLTIWPVSVYLFVQYLPSRKRWLYIAFWSLMMTLYLKSLKLLGVLSKGEHWTIYHTYLVVTSYFWIIYLVWRWLRQEQGGARQHD